MPIYLRNFYLKELVTLKKKEKREYEKAQKQTSVSRPSITPKFKRQ